VNLPGKSDATGKSSSCSVVARRLSIEEGSVGLRIAIKDLGDALVPFKHSHGRNHGTHWSSLRKRQLEDCIVVRS